MTYQTKRSEHGLLNDFDRIHATAPPRTKSCMMALFRSITLVLTAVLFANCGEKTSVDKPVAPDMSPLAAMYEHPTLTLDSSNIGSVASTFQAMYTAVDRIRRLLPSILQGIEGGLAEGTPQRSTPAHPSLLPQASQGEGYLQVHRICPGWNSSAAPDEENGAMDLTVGFTLHGVDPVVWGTMSRCRVRLLDTNFGVDGWVHVYLGKDVAFKDMTNIPLLFDLSVAFTLDEQSEPVALDLRLHPQGMVEYRVKSGDGFAVYWDTADKRGFRAANGNWTCDFDKKLCVADSGDQLSW